MIKIEITTFPKLKGLFSKWYCPKCNSILKRKEVKYREEYKGLYSEYWFICLRCGNTSGVKMLNKRIEEIVLQHKNK